MEEGKLTRTHRHELRALSGHHRPDTRSETSDARGKMHTDKHTHTQMGLMDPLHSLAAQMLI